MSRSVIISQSPKMQKILQLIKSISETATTVLITGETGTGKELIAKTIHLNSNRSSKPFVAINCGAIPSELMESELFGHEKGAFSGAHQKAMGKLEFADGGTVFLDEIATLPHYLQVKLLRVIQEKSFERVGSLSPIKIDVRFISATNANLYDEVKKGNFREDLYYRLNVLPIELPPLRERKEDIPLLVKHYLAKYGAKYCKKTAGITNEALEILANHTWPGNIRELQNILEMLIVLSNEDDMIDSNVLPSCLFKNDIKEPTYSEAIKQFEKEYILRILKGVSWNKAEAAKKMGIHRNTLLNKIKELGIEETR